MTWLTPDQTRLFCLHEESAGLGEWLIDVVSPFGPKENLIKDVDKSVFEGEPFKRLKRSTNGEVTVMTLRSEG